MVELNKISTVVILATIFLGCFAACATDTPPTNQLTLAKDEQATQALIDTKIADIQQLQKTAAANNQTIQDLEKEVAALNATAKQIEYTLDNINATAAEDVEKAIKKVVELTKNSH
jgi:septal ring factor EnvC (AmiA/AmiB activator)